MEVKVIAEITVDLDIYPEDPINCDSIGYYQESLDCELGNAALDLLSTSLQGKQADIEILSCKPFDEGLEEYRELLNNYQQLYNSRMEEFLARQKIYKGERKTT
jgi:hypothetical protein